MGFDFWAWMAIGLAGIALERAFAMKNMVKNHQERLDAQWQTIQSLRGAVDELVNDLDMVKLDNNLSA